MFTFSKNQSRLKRVGGYLVYLFVVWSLFRYFVRLPEVVEELWFKPVLWLVPLFWIWIMDKKRIEFFGGNWAKSILWGLNLGLLYLIVVFWVVGWRWQFGLTSLGVGFATAVVENLVFAGFVLPVMVDSWGKEKALLVNGVLFGLVHLPIAIFVYRADMAALAGLFLLSSSIGVMNGWVRLKTGNVMAAILASWMWIVAVV